MMYKAKVAVCSDICYKTLNAKRAQWRIFECQTWWYVKKPLGFKRLIYFPPFFNNFLNLFLLVFFHRNLLLINQIQTRIYRLPSICKSLLHLYEVQLCEQGD